MVRKSRKSLERADLLEAGREALDQAVERLQGRYTSKPDRLALMRIVAQLVPALSGCLKDGETEELLRRIEALEEVVKNKPS